MLVHCVRFVQGVFLPSYPQPSLGAEMIKRPWAGIVTVAIFAALAYSVSAEKGALQAAEPVSGSSDESDAFDPHSVPAGSYIVDPHHAALTGKIRHMGLSHFVFRFRRFDARFTYDPDHPTVPRVEVSVDPSSIDTNVDGFDTNMATSERHFNIAKFPEIKFVSDALKFTGADTGILEGQMTFLGVTKPFALNVTFLGVAQSRRGATVGLSATGTFKRSDYGFADGSGNLADDVVISIEGDFMQQL